MGESVKLGASCQSLERMMRDEGDEPVDCQEKQRALELSLSLKEATALLVLATGDTG